MTNRGKRSYRWILAIVWIITILAGWAIHWSPFLGGYNWMLDALSPTGKPQLPIFVFMAAIFYALLSGLIIGSGQWFILSVWMKPVKGWFLATFLGISIGWSLGLILTYPILLAFRQANGWDYGEEAPRQFVVSVLVQTALITVAIVGLLSGAFQWWAMHRLLKGGLWWVPLSAASWALGGAIYWFIYDFMGGPLCQAWNCEDLPLAPGYWPAVIISWVIGGIIIGGIISLAFRFLLSSASLEDPTNS